MSDAKKKGPKDLTQLTSIPLKDALAAYMDKLSLKQQQTPRLILEAWPQLVGEKLASMTKAVSFVNGVLTVKVNNSSLYSLLMQHEKPKLLKALKNKFPKVEIKSITFRIG